MEGNWAFEAEVTQLQEGITRHVFDTPLVKRYGDATVKIREVVTTPITTSVSFDWIEPIPVAKGNFTVSANSENEAIVPPPAERNNGANTPPLPSAGMEDGANTPPPPPNDMSEEDFPEEKTEEHIRYELIEGNGMHVEPFSFGGSASTEGEYWVHHNKALFAPTGSGAEVLRFRPVKEIYNLRKVGPGAYVSAEKPRHNEAALPAEFPIVLSQGEAGMVVIYSIDFEEERTQLHYEVRGSRPYEQDGAIWLEDGKGNRYDFDRYDQERLSTDAYEYRASLPTVKDPEQLVVKTVEFGAPHVLSELEFRIPLSR